MNLVQASWLRAHELLVSPGLCICLLERGNHRASINAKERTRQGRAGLNHMSDAVKISGSPREGQEVGEAEGQAVSPSLAFRDNYALLMADIGALPCI